MDGEEEVEMLLAFEHEGTQYNLVRLLDPILIVGKFKQGEIQNRVLLTPEESESILPALEDLFLEQRADE